MNKIETNLLDCYIIESKRFGDNRGFFESITKEELASLGFNNIFQISGSHSSKGTLRGLHFQKDPYCQAKVVRCTSGAVIDVVVDMRKDSDTYGKYTSVLLTPENGRMLYVPRGFAHGYLALEDNSYFQYLIDNAYMARLEGGIAWNDPDININWDEVFREYGIKEPILSEKDSHRICLKENTVIFNRKPTKFLITGINGQLGYDIVRELEERGEHEYYAPKRSELDITNRAQVIDVVTRYKPDVIIHCAAWTAVDKAENCEDDVFDINVTGTKNLVDASLLVDAKMMYMSTDYVFDGKKVGLYTEEDGVHPMNVYGASKYFGEVEVMRNPKHFITRISWVFGINGNNFVKTMLNLADKRKELNVVNDQVGSPTYTVDLAKLLVEMSYTDKYGIYHANNDGYCSWAEFAEYIMKSNGKETIINPVSTEEYLKITGTNQAYRPRNSKLSKEKLIQNGFAMLPSWQDATDRYCDEYKKVKKLW